MEEKFGSFTLRVLYVMGFWCWRYGEIHSGNIKDVFVRKTEGEEKEEEEKGEEEERLDGLESIGWGNGTKVRELKKEKQVVVEEEDEEG